MEKINKNNMGNSQKKIICKKINKRRKWKELLRKRKKMKCFTEKEKKE